MTAKILVVEDYPDNMALIEEILEDEGFEIVKAEDAEKGLEALNQSDIELVLMDVSLPKMSGLDATRLIKSNPATSAIPVVALTAHAMDKDREEAMQAGCSDFLTKPINESLLVSTINNILGGNVS